MDPANQRRRSTSYTRSMAYRPKRRVSRALRRRRWRKRCLGPRSRGKGRIVVENWITSFDEIGDDKYAFTVGCGTARSLMCVGFTIPPNRDIPVIPIVIPIGGNEISWRSVRQCLEILEDVASGEPRNWLHASFIGRQKADDVVTIEHFLKDERVRAVLQDISMQARRRGEK